MNGKAKCEVILRFLNCSIIFVAFSLLGVISFSGNAYSFDGSRRVALVIGNSSYKSLPALANPANDVREVAKTLRIAGFDVTVGIDVDRLSLSDTVRSFLRTVKASDVALLYYSGHGLQVDGQNFIIPVDATLDTPYDVETQTMSLDLILNYMRQNSREQLIFLDACRNNPFKTQNFWMANSLEPLGSRGLARIDSNLGSLIAFSTEPGQVALDGDGSLSPYTQSFVRNAVVPNKELRQVLTDVRRDVISATKGNQVPWENSSLLDSFYFVKAPPSPEVVPMQHVDVQTGTNVALLSLIAPHSEDGSLLTITFNELPLSGKLILDDKVLSVNSRIDAADISKLSYSVANVPADTIDLVGYTVADPYGQETRGVVVVTVSQNSGPKIAQAEQGRITQKSAVKAYLSSFPQDVSATIGIGPVDMKLPLLQSGKEETHFVVKSIPDSGVLRTASRSISLGDVMTASDVPALNYEPKIGTQGQNLQFAIASTDDDSATATVNLKPALDPCDDDAAAPLDLQGVAAGRLPNEIDSAVATSACEKAIKSYPAIARFVFELSRAQLAARDTQLAVTTMKRAMDLGHVRAAAVLAGLYTLGAIGPPDVARANQVVQLGAEKEDPYALYLLGKNIFYGQGTTADPAAGLRLMIKSAELGHTYAMDELAYIFMNGVNVQADPQRAIRFYQTAAARNDLYSLNGLALAYRFGRGVPQDLGRAFTLFKAAADGGQPYAPANLARMYRDGIGVAKDPKAAVKWLEVATERGDYWGALDRAHLAQTNEAGPIDTVTAVEYLAMAVVNNRPLTGDSTNQAAKELAALPSVSKRKGAAFFSRELTAQERTAALKTAAAEDDRLVALARAAWVKRNPRYDLF